MGKLLLILRLEGPLQSWGLRARWDVRDTGDEPSKSGVIGLLGCALGYGNGDERLRQLSEELTMGVRVERQGSKMVDFQTVSGMMMAASGKVRGQPDDPLTIVSPRTYLQDAGFLVALGGPSDILKQCAAALQSPRWPFYLGRKACIPSRPIFEELTNQYQSLQDTLTSYPWEALYDGEPAPARLRCILEDEEGTHFRPDGPMANLARMYQYRAVRVFWIACPHEGTRNGGGGG